MTTASTFKPNGPIRLPAAQTGRATEPGALAQGFFDEAGETLDALEQRLLSLSTAQADDEALHAIFRCAHSLKGGAASFGFADMATLTHQMETLLDRLRRHELAPTPGMVDVLLLAGDALRAQLARHKGSGAAPVDPRALLASIGALANAQALLPTAGSPAPAAAAPVRALELTLGPLPEPAVADAVAALFDELPGLGNIAPLDARRSQDDGMRRFKLLTAATDAELISLFGFHVPRQQVRLAPLVPPLQQSPLSAHAPLPGGHEPPAAADTGSLRVPVAKVDELVRLLAELAATQAALQGLAGSVELRQGLAGLARTTRDLQQAVSGMRKTPVAVVFNRFPRMLHDLAARLGKQIELVQVGGATTLDKGLVEKIADPLTHLLRNSCDHGIELPAERLAQGKPAHGTLHLSAQRHAAGVVIALRDDGRGLCRARLIAKARERGIAAPDEMPDAAVWALIYAPGFTTAEQVTDVSGRGVGMDVVHRAITALGGTVEIDSAEGQGMTVRLHLPLTHHLA